MVKAREWMSEAVEQIVSGAEAGMGECRAWTQNDRGECEQDNQAETLQ